MFFIHSSISGHVGWFCLWVIVKDAAKNMGAHTSFQVSVLFSSDKYLAEELLEHMELCFYTIISLPISTL